MSGANATARAAAADDEAEDGGEQSGADDRPETPPNRASYVQEVERLSGMHFALIMRDLAKPWRTDLLPDCIKS
jgi:hypothetical protein